MGRGGVEKHGSGQPTGETPWSELKKLRAEQERRDEDLRRRIMDALLELCGEVGYSNVSVGDIYRRYGGYRSQFYRYFDSKSDCFHAAFALEAERFVDSVIGAGSVDGGCEVEPAFRWISGYLADETLRARALFIEVHVVAGPSLEMRHKCFQRLVSALDSAYRDGRSPSHPPITAEFMVHAIDQAIISALIEENQQNFATQVPELLTLIDLAFNVKR